jgi:putative ABC transport system permease protein
VTVSGALAEAVRAARAQRTATLLVALLCGAICAVTLLTVGGTAAAEAQVLGRLDAAGSRLLVVSDTKGVGLVTPAAISVLGELDTVERAVGVDTPVDVRNSSIDGGSAAPAWRLAGPPEHAVILLIGRWPRPGEALVSAPAQRALGLAEPLGAVIDRDGREFPVVGAFAARSPFDFLGTGLVIRSGVDPVRSAYVVIGSATAARATEHVVIAALGPPDLSGIEVRSPTALADLRRVVGGDLGGFGRGLLLLTLAAGGVLLAVVVLAEVLLRRRDLGRRRALGSPRWGIVAIVVARTVVAAAPGGLAGLTLGAIASVWWARLPPWDFIAGTGILAVLTAAGAAVAPALLAGWRDPVAVLRTP